MSIFNVHIYISKTRHLLLNELYFGFCQTFGDSVIYIYIYNIIYEVGEDFIDKELDEKLFAQEVIYLFIYFVSRFLVSYSAVN